MSLSAKQRIFTRNIGCLIEYAYHIDIELTIGEGHRTASQILLNYYGYEVIEKNGTIELKKSRQLSKTLFSKHADRLAIDFNFFINGKLTYDKNKIAPLGEYWKSLHPDNRWGGDFKSFQPSGDTPHFEMS